MMGITYHNEPTYPVKGIIIYLTYQPQFLICIVMTCNKIAYVYV